MKKAVCAIGVLAFLAGGVTLVAILRRDRPMSQSQSPPRGPEQRRLKAGPVHIRVFPIDRASGYGPKLLVVIVNESQNEIFLQRGGLGDVEPWRTNALRAVATDLASGRSAYTRVVDGGGHKMAAWREDYFIRLLPGYAFGPVVDMRDHFILEHGHSYRVRFAYSSLAPTKVGRIKPWNGLAVSDEVLMEVP